ncbi:MAG: hypothetical protein K2J76_08955 [Oscillospiraceae bacterium]|nr:hypothetical protein [Oscillospiraceae bacterium]
MNKKIICLCLAALTLSACNDNQIDGDVSETTSLTLTESLTEEIPEPEPPEPEPMEVMEFAMFDPFYEQNQLYKDDTAVQEEMLAASEKLCDGLVLLDGGYGFYAKSKYYSNFADLDDPLEKDPMGDYTFCPLNTEIAASEDELFTFMRGFFTEEYLSDDELRSNLFESEAPYVPNYKTVDGTLCVLDTYKGMTPIWRFDQTTVMSYDGTSAEIAVYAPFDPAKMAFINMKKSEEYGWRLDGVEYTDYCPREASIMYNGIILKTETLNKILYGGNTPENAKTIEIDGEQYTETDSDMTFAEIQKFFAETFEADLYNREIGDKIINIEPNRTAYVDGVYAEQDGVLYRRNDAPRHYMPEMRLNAFVTLPSTGGDPGDWGFTCEQEFYDSVKDETFSQTISIHCLCNPDSYNTETGDYDEYYRIYIEKLPIREY